MSDLPEREIFIPVVRKLLFENWPLFWSSVSQSLEDSMFVQVKFGLQIYRLIITIIDWLQSAYVGLLAVTPGGLYVDAKVSEERAASIL